MEVEEKGPMVDRARDAAALGARRPRRGPAAAGESIDVQVYSDLDAVPDAIAAALARAGERSFFASPAWSRIVLRTAGSPADRPRLYAARSGGRVLATLIVRERERAGPLKLRLVTSPSRGLDAFANGPQLDAEDGAAGVHAIISAMLRAVPPVHVFRFECLEPGSRECRALLDALRRRHMLVRTFADRFFTCSEDVEGLTFDAYLQRRSPDMRAFIDRQAGALAASGRGRFELVTGGPELAAALVDYALVDLQSWKAQEPYPDCLARLLDTAARAGVLRLGLLYIDDRPAAAQIWIVSGGRATMWRSRFARQFALQSPGTVLTFEMIRHVLTVDAPSVTEFGPGDDPGRPQWLDRRHERIGVAVFNPHTAKGWGAAARHVIGIAAGSARRRLGAVRRRILAGG